MAHKNCDVTARCRYHNLGPLPCSPLHRAIGMFIRPLPVHLHTAAAALTALLLCSHCASPGSINRTIDDTYGDSVTGYQVVYSTDNWNVGQTCTDCFIHPNANLAYAGTWHDTSSSNISTTIRQATLQFTGWSQHHRSVELY